MKFPQGVKLSKVLAKDTWRPILTGAMIRTEKVEVRDPDPKRKSGARTTVEHLIGYATNSYTFARVDLGVPGDDDAPGPVPAVALKHAEKGVEVELGEKKITAGITHYDRVISDAPYKGKEREPGEEVIYPTWDSVYPEFGENVLKIGINPQLLFDLATALGSAKQGVVIELDMDKLKDIKVIGLAVGGKQVLSAMKVKPMGPLREQAEGIIMPIRVEI